MKIARKLSPERMFQIVWDNFAELQRLIDTVKFLGGVEISFAPVNGTNVIRHSLGREHRGFIILHNRSVRLIFEVQGTATDSSFEINCQTTGSDTALTMRVF